MRSPGLHTDDATVYCHWGGEMLTEFDGRCWLKLMGSLVGEHALVPTGITRCSVLNSWYWKLEWHESQGAQFWIIDHDSCGVPLYLTKLASCFQFADVIMSQSEWCMVLTAMETAMDMWLNKSSVQVYYQVDVSFMTCAWTKVRPRCDCGNNGYCNFCC